MMKNSLPQNLWLFIWYFLRAYKLPVSIFVALATLAGFWGPFNSMLIKQIINILPSAQETGDYTSLIWLGTIIVINFLIFDNVTWRSINYIVYKLTPVIKNQIISKMMSATLDHSHQFFQNNLSGRISNQITILADNIEIILKQLSHQLIRAISMIIIAFVSVYYVNSAFFYILFLWFTAFSVFSISMSKHVVRLSDTHARAETIISGQLVDSITNSSNVRIFAQKAFEVSRMQKFLFEAKRAYQKRGYFFNLLWITQGLMIAIMMGFNSYYLIYLYKEREISVGDFALILGLSMEVGHMMWYTMSQVDEFNQAVGKCRQSLITLFVPLEIKDKDDATDLIVTKGEIIFKAVKFHYKGTSSLFENKSVTIRAGQKVGLVGYSGSGKSSFVNLILRLYDVTDGQILIDGQDIASVTQESLRSNIAMIPQDPSLFHRSLKENISYGHSDVTDEKVIDSARRAHAHEFIDKLPEKYDSLVGERGIKLSGGQRQRIAIARAILKNAPILILDEATSQLDSVTENDIQDSLQDLMQHKTTLVIAHRLSTLLHIDRILVFDQGRIVEDGTHKELLALNGLYKTLWDAQIGGFLPEKRED